MARTAPARFAFGQPCAEPLIQRFLLESATRLL
jgi:hypothetical protein